jgi:DNA-binding FadR family transcriptional regulator
MPRLAPNVPLSERIANQLRQRIAEGEFPVGTLLPTEVDLAREFDVSRGCVREAVRSLVHAGMLGARAGYGTFVVATSDLAPALARRLEHDRIADVLEVRLLLEREGARLAATRATPGQREVLAEALAERAAARDTGDAPAYAEADRRFHRAIFEASGNVLLAELYRGAGGNDQALLHLDSPDVDLDALADDIARIDATHVELVAAIEARDPDRAADAAERMVHVAHAQAGFEPSQHDQPMAQPTAQPADQPADQPEENAR